MQDDIAGWQPSKITWTTVCISCASANGAVERFTRAMTKFRRAFPFAVVGVLHLSRARHGAWLAHAHLVVNGDPRDVGPIVRHAWAQAGANCEADYCKSPDSMKAVLRYSVNGANVAPPDPYELRLWLRALLGRRLLIRHRRARYMKRNKTTPT